MFFSDPMLSNSEQVRCSLIKAIEKTENLPSLTVHYQI